MATQTEQEKQERKEAARKERQRVNVANAACVYCGMPLGGHTVAQMQDCSNARS